MARQLYSTGQARKALGIGQTKLYELLASGELRSVKIGSRRLIPAEAIDEYITAVERGSDLPAVANG